MLHEIMLSLAVCLDTFLVALTYGSRNIKIPHLSALTMGATGSVSLFISILLSSLLGLFIPQKLFSAIGAVVLCSIGFLSVFKSILRHIIKHLSESGDICIKMNSIGLGIRLYLDDTCADCDCSESLSVKEAAALSFALSLDSAAIGLSSGFLDISPLQTAVMVFVFGTGFVYLGFLCGHFFSCKGLDFSWVCGSLLIILAVIGLI